MKRLSTCLVAASLVALAACGGGAEENVVANTDDLYNVGTTDDLLLDNGLGNGLDNGLEPTLDNSLANEGDSGAAGNATDSPALGTEALNSQ